MRTYVVRVGLLAALCLVAGSRGSVVWSHPDHDESSHAHHAEDLRWHILQDQVPPLPLQPQSMNSCTGGFAGGYPCNKVDLMAFMPIASIGGGANVADLWGWTDPLTGREYALVGRSTGTAFVDITDPANPVYLGNLPSHNGGSYLWREIKVYDHYALIVADNSSATNHGMQVFDLHQLRNVPSPPQTFTESAHYPGFSNGHNIVVNQETGFAYRTGGESLSCNSGLHMINIQNPLAPTFAGCFTLDGYVHDAQCVVYHGPDVTYQGHEICMGSDTDTLTIVDVTNKSVPVMVSRTTYPGFGYTHQGWFTENQVYFLLDDELDEQQFAHNTRTRIWDVSNLDAPFVSGIYTGPTTAIDHNLFIKGNYAYEANYRAGLRILDIANVALGALNEVAFFDVDPLSNAQTFSGAWGNYPFFASGTVIVSSMYQGLFILRPDLCNTPGEVGALTYPDKTTIHWGPVGGASTVYDVLRGGLASLPVGPGGGDEFCLQNSLAGTTTTDTADPAPGAGFWYLVRGQTACGTGIYGSQATSTTCP